MIDPFVCWEDMAESLKDARITGVANFRPHL
ncbi:putative TIM-barrel enzyme [Bradyrhizobium yuanmingense]